MRSASLQRTISIWNTLFQPALELASSSCRTSAAMLAPSRSFGDLAAKACASTNSGLTAEAIWKSTKSQMTMTIGNTSVRFRSCLGKVARTQFSPVEGTCLKLWPKQHLLQLSPGTFRQSPKELWKQRVRTTIGTVSTVSFSMRTQSCTNSLKIPEGIGKKSWQNCHSPNPQNEMNFPSDYPCPCLLCQWRTYSSREWLDSRVLSPASHATMTTMSTASSQCIHP